MLQAHHNHNPDSPHSGYITGVCHNIAVEVFDSVIHFQIMLVVIESYSFHVPTSVTIYLSEAV